MGTWSSEKQRAYLKVWRTNNPEKIQRHRRSYERKRKGIPQPTRPEPSACEICGTFDKGRWEKLNVDHCHVTGVFRGWLCTRCNVGLGLFADSSDLLLRAAKYLREVQI